MKYLILALSILIFISCQETEFEYKCKTAEQCPAEFGACTNGKCVKTETDSDAALENEENDEKIPDIDIAKDDDKSLPDEKRDRDVTTEPDEIDSDNDAPESEDKSIADDDSYEQEVGETDSDNPETDEDSLQCSENKHPEDEVCVSNTKSTPCRDEAPLNATSVAENVEITWNGTEWPEAQICNWNCDNNYHKNSGETACEYDFKTVPCQDLAPLNAASVAKNVQITWTGTEWPEAPMCSWNCNNNYHKDPGETACEYDFKSVQCQDLAPLNAASVIENVQISWTGSEWPEAPMCSWECDDHYHKNGNECEIDSYTIYVDVRGYELEVVLQNNLTDDLTITGNGTFSFSEKAPWNEAYSVTISSPPGINSCSVINGSGTVGESDITDIEVICGPKFSIGGTVSNHYPGMVIQNNGTDDLLVQGDTDFTFQTEIYKNEPYSVTVKNTPPGTLCIVENGEGAVTDSNIENINIECSSVTVKNLYPGFGDWNAYVKISDTSSECEPVADETDYKNCIHGGERKVISVTGKSSCINLTLEEHLGVFEWECVETDPVQFVTTSLKKGKGLSNLIEFTSGSWKDNFVVIKDNENIHFQTAPQKWWQNNIVQDNDGNDGTSMSAWDIYIVSNAASASYVIGSDKIALVINPEIELSGSGAVDQNVISATDHKFIWVEGRIDANSTGRGVKLDSCTFTVLRNMEISGAAEYGIHVVRSIANLFENLSLLNSATGFRLEDGGFNIFRDINSWSNSTNGIELESTISNKLLNIRAVNNESYGLYTRFIIDNSFYNVNLSNNRYRGATLSYSDNNRFIHFTSSGNHTTGIMLYSSENNLLKNSIAANNRESGVDLQLSAGNIIQNVASVNNGFNGFWLWDSENNLFEDVVSVHNERAFYLKEDNFGNIFNGSITTGDSDNCYAPLTEGHGLHVESESPGPCIVDSNLSAVITSGISLSGSFLAKENADDTVNSSSFYPSSPGTLAYSSITDWISFENIYRSFGKDGGDFPDSGNHGRCTSGMCRLWDWSLVQTDDKLRNIFPIPTGNDAGIYTWKAANSETCDKVKGAVWTGTKCQSTALKYSVELPGEGGNDNGICEANEVCLYTPNLTSYQGHGEIVNSIFGTGDGSIPGVTLKKYETNGY